MYDNPQSYLSASKLTEISTDKYVHIKKFPNMNILITNTCIISDCRFCDAEHTNGQQISGA